MLAIIPIITDIFSGFYSMDSWKLSILFVLTTGCTFYFFKMVTWENEANLKHEEFLSEAEARFGYGKAIPSNEITKYDQFKTDLYARVKTNVAKGCELNEDPGVTAESWMRKLGETQELQKDFERMCMLLIARAVANMPRYQLIQKDLKPKYMLHQKKLITDTQWQMFQLAQTSLAKELNFIRSEAEKLKEGWSHEDRIFQEAAQVAAQLRKQAMGREAFRHSGGSGPQ